MYVCIHTHTHTHTHYIWIIHSLIDGTFMLLPTQRDFLGCSDSKESACDAGDLGREHSLEKGMANPLQYSCLKNFMVRGVWQAKVHGDSKTRTRLSD